MDFDLVFLRIKVKTVILIYRNIIIWREAKNVRTCIYSNRSKIILCLCGM